MEKTDNFMIIIITGLIMPEIVKLNKNEKLSLSNDGNLSLFWVGIGSAFSKINYQNNFIIIKGNTNILVDCGTKCTQALYEYGINISGIQNLLITHSHADHIGGLEEFALMNRYAYKKAPYMIITKEYEEILWDHSLKGGCAYNERVKNKLLSFSDLFKPLRPEKLAEDPRELYSIDINDINIKLFRTMHIPDSSKSWRDSFISYGIIIDDFILFSSDTKFDRDLFSEFINEKSKIKYIFHDCQFFKGGVHASYEELMTLPDYIRGMMFLTHYGDNYADFDPVKDGFLGFTRQGTYYNF